MNLLETVFQDLQYGIRMAARNAGSSLVTVVALALGIGTNTAVFTAYKAMVARPLDARAPKEMVNLALLRDSGSADFSFSYPDYEVYRDTARSFSGLIAFRPARVTLSNAGVRISQRTAMAESGIGKLGLFPFGASNVEFAMVSVVSENYFQVLGVTALHGRTFESFGTSERAATPPVLIGENYWQRRFARDPAMLGKTIHLNGLAVTVAGITPHDFVGTGVGTPAFWLPVSLEPLLHAGENWLRNRENQRYRLFGRLAPGIGIGQAQAEMSSIAAHLRTLHDPRSEAAKPATVPVWPGSVFPLPLDRYGGLQLAIFLIMLAAGMVLIVACANVGSLQLARARSRENELRTRLSLGASRLRVIRQLVTESAVPALPAGMLAFLFSWALLKVSVILTSRFVLSSVMTKSRLFGITSIMAGSVLLAALLYEPSNIVTVLGLENVLSEGAVALLGLFIVAACGIGGGAALRFRPRPAQSPRPARQVMPDGAEQATTGWRACAES
jgi:hypothetical protein